jgi:predicted DNA repair protein MutK
MEKDKIKGAIRTDFVLSAEIIAITLGTVATATLATRALVLVVISMVMTVGVYGFVAGIVKLDDGGLALSRRADGFSRSVGRAILAGAPILMKLLSIVGTAAMFLVGGGILVHGIPPLHHLVEGWAAAAGGGFVGALVENAANGAVGVVAGGIVLGVVTLGKKAWVALRGPRKDPGPRSAGA